MLDFLLSRWGEPFSATSFIGHTPRSHRFVPGERIERGMYELLEVLIQAKYSRDRQELLRRANLNLEILRFQLRLAKDLQCLRENSYAFASRAVLEIGRMIGGWLRAGKENETSR